MQADANRGPHVRQLRRVQELAAARPRTQELTATSGMLNQAPVQMVPDWFSSISSAITSRRGATVLGLGLAGIGSGIALYRYLTRDRRLGQSLDRRMTALEDYEHDAETDGAGARLADQYRQLNDVEQTAHRWMRDRSATASDENHDAIAAILDRVAARRTALTRLTLAGNHPLWLPEGIGEEEAGRARGIWTSVLGGEGNIALGGDEGFRTRILADMSKLLQSQHGRDMLAELDAEQEDAEGMAINIAPGNGNEADPFDRPSARNGTGTGSLVTINHGAVRSPGVSMAETPLYSPSFITLGHELGHARRFLAGRGRDIMWGDDPEIEDEAVRDLWQNPEELENITGEENALRTAFDLPERQFHVSLASLFATRQQRAIRQRYDAMMDGVPDEIRDQIDYDTFDRATGWAFGWPYDGLPEVENRFQDPGDLALATQALDALEAAVGRLI